MLTGFVMEGLASGQIVSGPRNRLCLASRFASALDRCGLPFRAASASLSLSVPDSTIGQQQQHQLLQQQLREAAGAIQSLTARMEAQERELTTLRAGRDRAGTFDSELGLPQQPSSSSMEQRGLVDTRQLGSLRSSVATQQPLRTGASFWKPTCPVWTGDTSPCLRERECGLATRHATTAP